MDVFTHYVPEWPWPSAAEYRQRAIISMAQTMTAALAAMAGRH